MHTRHPEPLTSLQRNQSKLLTGVKCASKTGVRVITVTESAWQESNPLTQGAHAATHRHTNPSLRVWESQAREYGWKMLIMVDIKGPRVLMHHLKSPAKAMSHIQNVETFWMNSQCWNKNCRFARGPCTSYCIANSAGIKLLNISMIIDELMILTNGLRTACVCIMADLSEVAFHHVRKPVRTVSKLTSTAL